MLSDILGYIAGPISVAAITFTAIILTFKTRLVQIRKLPKAVAVFFKSGKQTKKGGISPFGAAATALSATLGTGNIAGVGAAILLGGAGAIFWMWASALLSMVTKYAEIALAVKYRKKQRDGSYTGGPMHYIKKATGSGGLAVFFAAMCVCASFFIGNGVQSATAFSAVRSTGIPEYAVRLVMLLFTFLAGCVIIGGIKRVAAVAQVLIPLLALFYIGCCMAVILKNIPLLPKAFEFILSSAFSPKAAAGGSIGYLTAKAVKVGFARGIFTNEAGLGSAPIVYASADSGSPAQSGLLGIFEVFLDTVVICTLTALTAVIYIIKGGECPNDGALLILQGFRAEIGSPAATLIGLSTILFGFAAIIAWGGYGQTALCYITKRKSALRIYKALFIFTVFYGGFAEAGLLWGLADIFNALMLLPNLLAILLLSNEVKVITCSLYQKAKIARNMQKTEAKRRL